MTATVIIELLLKHPRACGLLDCEYQEFQFGTFRMADGFLYLMRRSSFAETDFCVTWLTGAAVEKCDELGIIVGPSTENGVRVWHLHASLAGLEAHAKEESTR
jgi:hypothetical protein